MPSYDNPQRETMCFPSKDFSSTDVTYVVRGPNGMRGKLRDIIAPVTVTCAGATTKPKLQVGISGTLTKYADMDMGVTAADACKRASQTSGDIKLVNGLEQVLDADTDIYITLKAATGAGAAGTLVPMFVFEWF